MSYVKPAIIALAALAMSAPSLVQAQNFTRRGTRTGAIAGAIIGGLIGADNDEALAGAAIGGVIGGVTGRAIGQNRDAQYWNGGGYSQTYYQQPVYYHGGYGQSYGVQYVPQVQYAPVQYAPAPRVYYQRSIYSGGYRGGGRVYYGGW